MAAKISSSSMASVLRCTSSLSTSLGSRIHKNLLVPAGGGSTPASLILVRRRRFSSCSSTAHESTTGSEGAQQVIIVMYIYKLYRMSCMHACWFRFQFSWYYYYCYYYYFLLVIVFCLFESAAKEKEVDYSEKLKEILNAPPQKLTSEMVKDALNASCEILTSHQKFQIWSKFHKITYSGFREECKSYSAFLRVRPCIIHDLATDGTRRRFRRFTSIRPELVTEEKRWFDHFYFNWISLIL